MSNSEDTQSKLGKLHKNRDIFDEISRGMIEQLLCKSTKKTTATNNIDMIDGVADDSKETWAETEVKVRNILAKHLQLDSKTIEIERAHRNGPFKKEATRPRQIVAKLLRYKDKQMILSRARTNLKNTPIFVNEDYSELVRKRRAELLPEMKAARLRGDYAFAEHLLMASEMELGDVKSTRLAMARALLTSSEDKTTVHGRRHESVLYTHYRVKGKDYGAPKSPQRLRTGTSTCVCTHHQRKHMALAKEHLFGKKADACRNHALLISMDDKAYLRPGTSEAVSRSMEEDVHGQGSCWQEGGQACPAPDCPQHPPAAPVRRGQTACRHTNATQINQTVPGANTVKNSLSHEEAASDACQDQCKKSGRGGGEYCQGERTYRKERSRESGDSADARSLLAQKNDQKDIEETLRTTYWRWRTGLLDTEYQPVVGTDDERGMRKAVLAAFPKGARISCVRHLKNNVADYLRDTVGMDAGQRKDTLKPLFGKEENCCIFTNIPRPGFLESCEEGRQRDTPQGMYTDVYDGKVWSAFQVVDGKPFLADRGNLAFMLNVDWFQPYKCTRLKTTYTLQRHHKQLLKQLQKKAPKLETVRHLSDLEFPGHRAFVAGYLTENCGGSIRDHLPMNFRVAPSSIMAENEVRQFITNVFKYPRDAQTHCERIVDFLLPGHGVYWHKEEGQIVFHDSPNDQPNPLLLANIRFPNQPSCYQHEDMVTGYLINSTCPGTQKEMRGANCNYTSEEIMWEMVLVLSDGPRGEVFSTLQSPYNAILTTRKNCTTIFINNMDPDEGAKMAVYNVWSPDENRGAIFQAKKVSKPEKKADIKVGGTVTIKGQEAFCPDGNQQAGRIKDFSNFLNVKFNMVRDTRMKVFRANRFNILFECAAGVFYHSSHLRTMFEEGYVKAGNKLLRAVLADISSEPLLVGCRALAIIYVHITEPYWRLVESNNVHILDLTKSLKEVMVLFQQCNPSEEMTDLTEQALEVIMANIGVVIQRRFKDQAPLANSSDPTLRADTADMNKSNKRGENDFGYWSYMQIAKPLMDGMAAEGQLMFKFNSTDAWLDALATEDPAKPGGRDDSGIRSIKTERKSCRRGKRQSFGKEQQNTLRTLERRKSRWQHKGHCYRSMVGRFRVKGWKELEKLYTVYYNKYFARKQPRATKSQCQASTTAAVPRVRVTRPDGTLLALAEERGRQGETECGEWTKATKADTLASNHQYQLNEP
ncbi:hypothetical protein Bbelb_049070 [Branchiostoma belcheri]|nr:hypothetical protein Bbelb_049070 [Branchiostoma belcheri]